MTRTELVVTLGVIFSVSVGGFGVGHMVGMAQQKEVDVKCVEDWLKQHHRTVEAKEVIP